jgi:RNA-directed DNA polymerase
VTCLGLTLNETKTTLKEAHTESFDFLGYTFGPHGYWKNGRRYLGASPSKKSVARLRQKVNDVLRPGNKDPWPEVRDRLSRLLQGWSNYFSYGTRARAYRAIDHHVADRVRSFLRRRRSGQRRHPLLDQAIFSPLGVRRLVTPQGAGP